MVVPSNQSELRPDTGITDHEDGNQRRMDGQRGALVSENDELVYRRATIRSSNAGAP